jgi:segregation and condensation protein B
LEIKALQVADMDRFLEALLFVADGPVSLQDLTQALEIDRKTLIEAVQRLVEASATRGLHVVRNHSRIQMITAPDAGPVIERFLGIGHSAKLSSAALETLAIIAYRQPVTRAQIEAVRGVNSDGVLRTLIAKSLVAPQGRLEQAGRPVIFATTFEFLQYFGISSLEELPTLPEFAGDLEEKAAL